MQRKAGLRKTSELFYLITLFQILQTGFLPLQDGAHPTQSGSLQLFAAIHGVSILHQTHVIFGDAAQIKENPPDSQSVAATDWSERIRELLFVLL